METNKKWTLINPLLNKKTEVNESIVGNDLADSQNIANSISDYTEINPTVHGNNLNLPAGTIIGKNYMIAEPLNKNSGEAELYICEYRNRKYVAKIYRRSRAIKPEVIEALTSVNSPYVAKIHESGVWNGFPYEILPYYKYGSLEGRTFNFSDLEKTIIPELNAGLHSLHRKGIIHKDLKPANIMLCDNQNDIAIIDFGISSVRENGNTVVMTKTGMTPEYSASETFRNLFLEESDYYSLGITIYELFCGKTPYAGMTKDAIEQFVSVQKIPFPDTMPVRLQNLISGLTYNDITNRKDKNNPNRRWTYDEVNKWCKGESLTVPGGKLISTSDTQVQPYTFYRRKYYTLDDLALAMLLSWENGKKHLYRSTMSDFFRKSNPDLANICIDAEEAVAKDKKKADILFFKAIYQMAPDTKYIIWKGENYGTPVELGLALMNSEYPTALADMISQNLFSTWVSCKYPDYGGLTRSVAAAEYQYNKSVNSFKDSDKKILSTQIIGRILSGNVRFTISNKVFNKLDDFAKYCLDLKKNNSDEFLNLCKIIIPQKGELMPEFEAWLMVMGKGSEISEWKESY